MCRAASRCPPPHHPRLPSHTHRMLHTHPLPDCSPLELVESLRAALPATNPMTVQRRMALENVIQMLTGGCLFACGVCIREDVDGRCPPLHVAAPSYPGRQHTACSGLLPAGGVCERRHASAAPCFCVRAAANMFGVVDPIVRVSHALHSASHTRVFVSVLQPTCLRMWTPRRCWRSG